MEGQEGDQLHSNSNNHSSDEERNLAVVPVEVDPEPDSSSLNHHVCEYRGKKFDSGKAAQRDLVRKNKKSILKSDQDGGSILKDEKIHDCYVCKRKFPSDKALYGHLRKHPERTWRGSQPPSDQPKSGPNHPSLSIASSSVSSLSSGTTTPAGSGSRSSSDLKISEKSCVNVLLMLAFATIKGEKGSVKIQSKEPSTEKLIIDNKRNKSSDVSRKVSQEAKEDHHTDAKIYICSPCNKSFTSHQAYGGHVSSHNRSKAAIKIGADSTPDGSSSKPQVRDPDLSGQGRRRVLVIDLNELPPEEEEVERGGSEAAGPTTPL